MAERPWAARALHFIGIGGAGMSGLALVAQALGAQVTGSDRAASSYTARLRAAGLEPALGHDPSHVPTGAEVVVSTAIGEDNPELGAARLAGATVLHRGDVLGQVAGLRRCIAVAGTHGKTTTSAMTATVLEAAGRRPSYLIGGELRGGGGGAAWRSGEWIVVEADESDRSFLKLDPEVAVVTNVELDHHGTYPSALDLEQTFAQFAERARARVRWIDAPLPGEAVTYGIEAGALRAEDVRLLPLRSRFRVEGVEVELRVPGRHNVLNALAALGACREAGVELAEGGPALGRYTGTARRFESLGTTPGGARVFDDYAHHPTEVRATLEAARSLEPDRLVACFQPHLYSRTRHLARDFGRALALADLVVVLDVYPARERQEDYPEVSGLLVARAAAHAARGRPVHWLPRSEDAVSFLEAELRAGDVLLTLGAGDVNRLAERLVAHR